MLETPKKGLQPPDLPSTSTSTPSRSRTQGSHLNTHRLLYRGALSLPDSHMLLDGLSFVAETRVGHSPSVNLLENPLALALESMRGRPSLHLLGTEKLGDIRLDTRSNVNVYIHPYSTLSHIYFENILCLAPIISAEGFTEEGIRVSLSDSSEPGPNDFLIYGQVTPTDEPLPSTSKTPTTILHILAAQILPKLLSTTPRAPRPDDPTPRQPPTHLLEDISTLSGKRKRESSVSSLLLGGGRKRSKVVEEDEQVRRAREVMLHMPKPSRHGKPDKDAVFKVPQVPARQSSVPEPDDDTFGAPTVTSKGKQQAGSDELEKANKTVVKQAAVTFLSHHGIKKGDPDFTDFYQTIYRGVVFALRNVMRTQAVKLSAVERLCNAHWRIYADGSGEMSSR